MHVTSILLQFQRKTLSQRTSIIRLHFSNPEEYGLYFPPRRQLTGRPTEELTTILYFERWRVRWSVEEEMGVYMNVFFLCVCFRRTSSSLLISPAIQPNARPSQYFLVLFPSCMWLSNAVLQSDLRGLTYRTNIDYILSNTSPIPLRGAWATSKEMRVPSMAEKPSLTDLRQLIGYCSGSFGDKLPIENYMSLGHSTNSKGLEAQ